MGEENKSQIYLEFEKKLVEIFTNIGQMRGGPYIISSIISYFIIRGSLTQEEISKLTGYSLSTISPVLFSLLTLGTISKKFIPGTHTNHYYLTAVNSDQGLFNLGFTKLQELESLMIFLSDTISTLNGEKYKKLSGSSFLSSRLIDLMDFLHTFNFLMEFLSKNKRQNFNHYQEISKLATEDVNSKEIVEFHPSVEDKEREIINFCTNISIFILQENIFSLFTLYFVTRQIMTQKLFRRLLNYSTGKISKEVNKLVRRGMVNKVRRTESGKILYEMVSVKKAFVQILVDSINDILKIECQLKTFKEEFRATVKGSLNKEERKKLKDSMAFLGSYFAILKRLKTEINALKTPS